MGWRGPLLSPTDNPVVKCHTLNIAKVCVCMWGMAKSRKHSSSTGLQVAFWFLQYFQNNLFLLQSKTFSPISLHQFFFWLLTMQLKIFHTKPVMLVSCGDLTAVQCAVDERVGVMPFHRMPPSAKELPGTFLLHLGIGNALQSFVYFKAKWKTVSMWPYSNIGKQQGARKVFLIWIYICFCDRSYTPFLLMEINTCWKLLANEKFTNRIWNAPSLMKCN